MMNNAAVNDSRPLHCGIGRKIPAEFVSADCLFLADASVNEDLISNGRATAGTTTPPTLTTIAM